ncbi:ShlB/FhaC/HecB family hemolysin secretion/activation protein [Pseudodesulfovibrio sp.]|uniref:ShlB/FhaC/HecB family hemolysin secretion/activation protein n=1 Tax=unclassified Pseudodesulfovibrio TaxID=2661612 RepID=UPI003AFFC5B0
MRNAMGGFLSVLLRTVRGVAFRGILVGIFLAFASGVFPGSALSAPVDEAIRQQQQIQMQEEQRRQELQRQHLKELQRPPSGEEQRLPKGPKSEPGAPCFEAKSIELSGATLLSQREIAKLIGPYIGKCLTLADVNNLVRDVTNAYVDKGYVTTRVAVPEQDFSTGKLVLLVVEGKVEGIESKDGQESSRELKGAFPGLSGKYLNLRDIEQGLDQMNRLPSNSVKMELAPGSTPGTSRVMVSNKRDRTWRFSAGLDNSGQDSTGRSQYVLSLGKDNLLGINDLLSVTLNGDAQAWMNDEHQRSATWNAFYSVPVGYWTFSGSLSYYDYRTNIFGGGMDYSSYGDTTTTSLTADRVIQRDSNGKTSLALSLTHRNIRNYFNGERLDATSHLLSSLGATLGHNRRILGGVATVQLGISQGVPILGAKRDRTPSLDTPRNQFSKITYYGSFYRPFQVQGTDFSWSTQVSGQWAPHTLYSAERISIGSRYTVRGFHDDSLSGDIGGYVRNELALNIPADQMKSPFAADWFGSLQFYAGYDAGYIRRDPKEDEEQGSLQGAVVGLRTSGGRLLLDLAVSRPISAPTFLKHSDLEFYTSLKYSF